MSVADRIIELRKKHNMSQANLADAVGVTRQAVSKWETGQSLPDSGKLILLAQVLSTDIEYLSTGRVNDAIRPPVVIKSVEKVEVPVIQVVEKPVEVEKIVEVPVIQYIEKPIEKRVVRVVHRRNLWEYVLIGVICFLFGLLIGSLL